jgi:hypothetical protein
MNLNARLSAVGKKTAIICGILIAIFCVQQSIDAQTSLATNALLFSNGGAVMLRQSALPQPDMPPPWTAEMWVNPSAGSGGASEALWNSTNFGLKLQQFGAPNQNVGFTIYGQADYYFNYTAPKNTWTHLAFVGTSSNITLYANGVAVDTNAVSISMPLTQFGNPNVDYLNAMVDEVAVWSNALSAAQIKENYHFPITPQPGLVLLLHLDQLFAPNFVTDSYGHNTWTVTNVTLVTSTAPIYLQTLTVTPPNGHLDGLPHSLSNAVEIANSIGEMIINFDPSYAGSTQTLSSELDITNDMTITGTNLASTLTLTTDTNRHFSISSPANVTISGLTLQGGIAEPTDLIGAYGGSISNAGNLTLNNVTFTGNQALGGTNGNKAFGGAIYNATQSTLTINQCTFNQNSAIGGDGAGGSRGGGAIYNAGTLTANLSSFYNQTVAGSSGFAEGGAIFSATPGIVVINECTLTSNTVTGNTNGTGVVGGGAICSLGNLAINQSTLAGNILIGYNPSGPAIVGGSVFQNLTGSAAVFNSILGPDNGATQMLGDNSTFTGTNLIDAAPEFAPLDNYDGPTLTMPLMAGSPGVDAADDSATNEFATDQRGYPRLYGAHVDIGAVESMPPTLSNVSVQIISTNTATGTYTVEFQASENPNGAPSTATAQYGQTGNTAGSTVVLPDTTITDNVSITVDMSRNYLFNWDIIASNLMGVVSSPDLQASLPPFPTDVAGDLNGDGVVSQSELNQVYSNYLATSPYLLITNSTGLGQSNVNFTVSNGLISAYTVQTSTDLVNWVNLGPALPLYNFTDTNAPAAPQRFYRLVYP